MKLDNQYIALFRLSTRSTRTREISGFAQYAEGTRLGPYANPIFAKGIPSARSLEALEGWAKKKGFAPYFNALASKRSGLNRLERRMAALGWKVSKSSILNIWTEPLPIEMPKGISIEVGDYFDARLQKDYRKLTKRVFKLDEAFVSGIVRFARECRGRFFVLVARRGARPVATAIVMVAGSNALLFGGCVEKSSRRRGIWNAMVALRQAVTQKLGARRWFLVTENPAIAGRCDETLAQLVFQKTAHG